MMLAINIELGLHAGVGRNRAAVCRQAWMLMLGHPEVAEAARASWVLINCENLFTLFCSQLPKVMATTYFQKITEESKISWLTPFSSHNTFSNCVFLI